MTHRKLTISIALVTQLTFASCSGDDDMSDMTGNDAGSDASVNSSTSTNISSQLAASCYFADDQGTHYCNEWSATLGIKSDCEGTKSGTYSEPPACPKKDYVGRCTLEKSGLSVVQRYYKPVTTQIGQDVCTASDVMGQWTTAE